MINREMKDVTVKSFTSTISQYGQPRQTVASTRTVKMVSKIYSQQNQQNPKYIDITMLGITRDSGIDAANEITIDGKDYIVKYVIPSGKYYQILMENK